MSGTVPLVMSATGPVPATPAALNAQLIALAVSYAPGLTTALPGSLIEDISSTDTGALITIDQARVDTINSFSPFTANEFILNQLGPGVYGVQPGQTANTSVYVTFTGTVGYPITIGFTVSDGTHQYTVQDGGIILTGGSSAQLFCVATQTGSWAVPTGTVTQLVTSVDPSITLSCTNLSPGTPSAGTQTAEQYRAAVLQAGLAASTGMGRYLRTLLENVPGVQPQLVSVQQQSPGWKVLCGGGDPYAVANAILQAVPDISSLVGSVMSVEGISLANPAVVTTLLNHGYTTGTSVTITGIVGTGAVSGLNGVAHSVTVITEKTFSVPVDTTGGTYTSGGVCSPNARNITTSINDPPDTYTIIFVNPPQQTVTMTVTWNTTSPNFVSNTAMSQAAQPAIVAYVNAITAGQPMNQFELESVFQIATAAILATPLLTRLVFAVSINGVGTSPTAGTGVISGDPESYFYATTAGINVVQG